MRIEYDNYLDRTTELDPLPYFTTINKIVLKGESQPDITMYYGSDESLLGLSDINEYGWEFLVNKYKYDDTDVLSLLPFAVKNNIGTSMSDIETLRKALFPTIAGEETRVGSDSIEYFGTLSVGRQKLLIVRIPPKYSIAELWDTTDIMQRTDYIDSDTGEIKYSEYERFVNNSSIDDSSDRRSAPVDGLDTVVTLLPKIKVSMDGDEITCTDLVWFVISTGTSGQSSVSNINLSFLSWEGVKNPHRNLHEYLLRNDDKAFIETTTKVVEYDSVLDQYMDKASGTLVGNKKIYNHPLLDKAVFLANTNQDWDRNAIYDRGEKAVCKGVEYVSLVPKNRGNYPLWNPSLWMKSDIMPSRQECFGAKIISLRTSGTGMNVVGSIQPSSVIISSDVERGSYKKFNISYLSCGVLQENSLVKFKDNLGNIVEGLLKEKEYQAFRYNNREQEVWIDLYDLINNVDSSNSITMNFVPIDCQVKGIVINEETGNRTDLSASSFSLGGDYTYYKDLQTGFTTTVSRVVKNYYINGTFLGSVDLPESKYYLAGESTIIISDTMDIPASIVYEVYARRLQHSLLISEYPGFIVDYVERKVNVSDIADETPSPASIKFRPVDGDFEKIVSVSAMWDDVWHESILSTVSIERMSYTAQSYAPAGQPVDTWVLKKKLDQVTGLPKYYEVEIPNVIKDITFALV